MPLNTDPKLFRTKFKFRFKEDPIPVSKIACALFNKLGPRICAESSVVPVIEQLSHDS
jgi:hypothetical protein